VYLCKEQCVDAGTTREDDQWKADDGANDKAQLDDLIQQRRLKVHEDIA